MNIKRTTDPMADPITDTEVEEALRIDAGTHATMIARLIKSSTQRVEHDTERSLINQSWTLNLDKWPKDDIIYLPYGPFSSITSFSYFDTAGSSQNLVVDTDYYLDSSGDFARLKPINSWPSLYKDKTDVVTLVYVAGYGAANAAIPDWAQEAIIRDIVMNYEGIDQEEFYQKIIRKNKLFFDFTWND